MAAPTSIATPLFKLANGGPSTHGSSPSKRYRFPPPRKRLGIAAHTGLKLGFGYTTLKLKVLFLCALNDVSGKIIVVGRRILMGGRAASSEATLFNKKRQICVTATSTLLVSNSDQRKPPLIPYDAQNWDDDQTSPRQADVLGQFPGSTSIRTTSFSRIGTRSTALPSAITCSTLISGVSAVNAWSRETSIVVKVLGRPISR
jgi:hypothetical protein